MAFLILENGTVFEGQRFGALGDTVGEVVFTTGMVGYPETLTDPAYAGQLVVQTFPMVGNYGIIPEDIAPTAAPGGYIVREYCEQPSNFRCEQTLDAFLKQQGVVGLCGIDTRELTTVLREHGTMNAMICDTVPDDLTVLREYTVGRRVADVSCTESRIYPAVGEKRYAITLVDLGTSLTLVHALCEHGCEVTVVPHDTSASAIKHQQPDGVVFAGGPGDPRDCTEYLPVIRELFGRLPMLGVGLGHQLIALSQDGAVEKLPYGHRGANQPVKIAGTSRRTYITNQNHGYVVSEIPEGALPWFRNANDNTCEGIYYTTHYCVTVQFDPNDVVFDRFFALMGGADHA